MKSNPNNYERRQAMTLVELLVVIAILSIITALLVPQLRTINRDRAIREAARVVGAVISKGVQRATLDDGEFAGFAIERNPNIWEEVTIGGNLLKINFAGTRLYVLRSVAPFAGDSIGDVTANINSFNGFMEIRIPVPLEHTLEHPFIQAGDRISLSHGNVKYPIMVDPTFDNTGATPLLVLTVGLGWGNTLPLIENPIGSGVIINVPYLVHRRPKRLESSKVDLPEGYMIDLRFSGPELPVQFIQPNTNASAAADSADVTTYCRQLAAFGQDTIVVDPSGNETATIDDIEFLINKDGAIDSIQFAFRDTTGFVRTENVIPLDMIHLLVTEYQTTSHDLPDGQNSSLYDPDAMWVTIDYRTGSSNIAYNAPPAGVINGLNFKAGLEYARGFASGKRSADQ